MTDQNATPIQPARVFKIGATRIVEHPCMSAATNEQVLDLLKMNYPEIANATLREHDKNGTRSVVR